MRDCIVLTDEEANDGEFVYLIVALSKLRAACLEYISAHSHAFVGDKQCRVHVPMRVGNYTYYPFAQFNAQTAWCKVLGPWCYKSNKTIIGRKEHKFDAPFVLDLNAPTVTFVLPH